MPWESEKLRALRWGFLGQRVGESRGVALPGETPPRIPGAGPGACCPGGAPAGGAGAYLRLLRSWFAYTRTALSSGTLGRSAQ